MTDGNFFNLFHGVKSNTAADTGKFEEIIAKNGFKKLIDDLVEFDALNAIRSCQTSSCSHDKNSQPQMGASFYFCRLSLLKNVIVALIPSASRFDNSKSATKILTHDEIVKNVDLFFDVVTKMRINDSPFTYSTFFLQPNDDSLSHLEDSSSSCSSSKIPSFFNFCENFLKPRKGDVAIVGQDNQDFECCVISKGIALQIHFLFAFTAQESASCFIPISNELLRYFDQIGPEMFQQKKNVCSTSSSGIAIMENDLTLCNVLNPNHYLRKPLSFPKKNPYNVIEGGGECIIYVINHYDLPSVDFKPIFCDKNSMKSPNFDIYFLILMKQIAKQANVLDLMNNSIRGITICALRSENVIQKFKTTYLVDGRNAQDFEKWGTLLLKFFYPFKVSLGLHEPFRAKNDNFSKIVTASGIFKNSVEKTFDDKDKNHVVDIYELQSKIITLRMDKTNFPVSGHSSFDKFMLQFFELMVLDHEYRTKKMQEELKTAQFFGDNNPFSQFFGKGFSGPSSSSKNGMFSFGNTLNPLDKEEGETQKRQKKQISVKIDAENVDSLCSKLRSLQRDFPSIEINNITD